MKIKFFYLMLLSLLFYACNQDEYFDTSNERTMSPTALVTDPLITLNWNTQSQYMNGGKYEKAISLTLSKSVIIDWGDGSMEIFTELKADAGGYAFYHYYTTAGNYTVKIYGEDDAITTFQNSNAWSGDGIINKEYSVASIDLSKCPSLKILYFSETIDATYLDVSFNHNLERLYCPRNNFTQLRLYNPKLEVLMAGTSNRLTHIEALYSPKLMLVDTRKSNASFGGIYLRKGQENININKDDHTNVYFMQY